MNGITVILPQGSREATGRMVEAFSTDPEVARILVLCGGDQPLLKQRGVDSLRIESLHAGGTWSRILEAVRTEETLAVLDPDAEVLPLPGSIAALRKALRRVGTGMAYGGYRESGPGGWVDHPVNPYQPGSIREGFDFGPAVLLSMAACRSVLETYGTIPDVRAAGFYDLRLKLSLDHRLRRLDGFLFSRKQIRDAAAETGAAAERHFDYVDPRNREAQVEFEAVATAHLKRLGAYLPPAFRPLPRSREVFPVEASVVIPVKNRKGTVAEAAASALGQETDFPFNVLVVDNHSTDGTTGVLAGLARRNRALRHIVPTRTDLNIGGCWNEAVRTSFCGRYAVQLDSDDLYEGKDALQRIVDLLRQGPYAMAVGSYRLVDERLREIPPGLIDHREWTPGNGRNNALRINGLGAPRAFDTAVIRRFGFPDVGYGEDYAVALRISRDYQIGRIYESLYLCRRWGGNTDAALSVEAANRNDAYKDRLRTLEITARRRKNRRTAERRKERNGWNE
ncbi:MAG TPA: glycosyltransferase family 2 protein [Syntrophales bacterium]|nr:glycosyltransferase family 2 protein [Syntrophales bacterium]